MDRKEKRPTSSHSDKVKSIIRHVQKQNAYFSPSSCVFHFNKPCLTLLNNFNSERFHCLFASHAVRWCSYSITKSCDIPELFYDMMVLNRTLGDEYVLPFAGHFRESSGYTIGMFRQDANLYPPHIIDRSNFIETVFTMIVFFVAACHRMGGSTPNIKHFSVLFTKDHPVLCDIGSFNLDARERSVDRKERFNKKKWKRFLLKKTNRSIIQHLKIYFPKFFQKKKTGKRCILNDEDGEFCHLTHRLVCQSEKTCLLDVLKEFKFITSNSMVYRSLIEWIMSINEDLCYIEED